mmetsp:Transcript_9676/g.22088  ORF Transcript_9676/g.22088 Transcript_9676/m.22088 type:complete len:326 (+) Transcript_9676:907-1884(+)
MGAALEGRLVAGVQGGTQRRACFLSFEHFVRDGLPERNQSRGRAHRPAASAAAENPFRRPPPCTPGRPLVLDLACRAAVGPDQVLDVLQVLLLLRPANRRLGRLAVRAHQIVARGDARGIALARHPPRRAVVLVFRVVPLVRVHLRLGHHAQHRARARGGGGRGGGGGKGKVGLKGVPSEVPSEADEHAAVVEQEAAVVRQGLGPLVRHAHHAHARQLRGVARFAPASAHTSAHAEGGGVARLAPPGQLPRGEECPAGLEDEAPVFGVAAQGVCGHVAALDAGPHKTALGAEPPERPLDEPPPNVAEPGVAVDHRPVVEEYFSAR